LIPTLPPHIGGVSPEGNLFSSGQGGHLHNVAQPDYFPNSDKTQKGHMKGQQKGVRLMKVRAPRTIKIELGTQDPPPPTIKKHYDIFIVVYELLDTVHTDQTGVFPITLQ
jgi:hypothetical protein